MYVDIILFLWPQLLTLFIFFWKTHTKMKGEDYDWSRNELNLFFFIHLLVKYVLEIV